MSQLFHKSVIIDDFVSSRSGLILASFNYNGDEEVDLALGGEIETVFLNNNRVATLVDVKFTEVLSPRITLVSSDDTFISSYQLREVLRQLTGKTTWSWMQVYDELHGETLFYKCIVSSIKCQKIRGNIAGIVVEFKCDSAYARTKLYTQVKHITTEKNTFTLLNTSDELNDYLDCIFTINATENADVLSIKNEHDNNRVTLIEDVTQGESIYLDSSNEEITTSSDVNILDRFNFKFPKMIPGENKFIISSPCDITIKYRLLRKVGV